MLMLLEMVFLYRLTLLCDHYIKLPLPRVPVYSKLYQYLHSTRFPSSGGSAGPPSTSKPSLGGPSNHNSSLATAAGPSQSAPTAQSAYGVPARLRTFGEPQRRASPLLAHTMDGNYTTSVVSPAHSHTTSRSSLANNAAYTGPETDMDSFAGAGGVKADDGYHSNRSTTSYQGNGGGGGGGGGATTTRFFDGVCSKDVVV